jgi:2-dehydro-3-deoxyglucarate aldolase/4-hydroxy-2-oxoheptanedioate aldolase
MTLQHRFRERLQRGAVALGCIVSFTDPAVSEALAGGGLDFVWIDMEHGGLGIETTQRHIMAAQLAGASALVRVPWNDPVLIKPVLDAGADGVIVPLIRTPADARNAVAACRYPPEGVRGFGPRRPANYGRRGGPDFCQAANRHVMVIPQIEHIDAVRSLDEILETPGVEAVMIGPNDLSGSLGLLGQTGHPEVVRAIETVIEKARRHRVFVGIAVGRGADDLLHWIRKGVQWAGVGADFLFMTRALDAEVARIRQALEQRG